MAKGEYIGVSGKAKKVKKIYVGIGGKAKKVKKAYIGVNGVAKLFYSAFSGLFGTMLNTALIRNTYDGTTIGQETVTNNKPVCYLVYCNGYFWACASGYGDYKPLFKSADMINWTQVGMSISCSNSSYNDGAIIANSKFLCLVYNSDGSKYAIIYNTETGTTKQLYHTYYALQNIGLTADDKFILFWYYTSGPPYYRNYTIYDPSTDTESSFVAVEESKIYCPLKYATSSDRMLITKNNILGYFKNNAITMGSVTYTDGINGIVFGNGKFTDGSVTSTDGINWTGTPDITVRGVHAFGDGLFIRYWKPDNSGPVYLQISEDGINWTTIKSDIPLTTYSSFLGCSKQASAAFKPI